ncbi:MAG: Y-family DNA polymerase, partial [Rhodospirillaceae bacterium]|nr:Y-family DNA polymerase [Rhodospirillaceae bacterium]
RPDLEGRPVAVLSNNDGCIIARSNEVKALGVQMGTPYFKVRHMLAQNGVHVFSSNYVLYGDLSARVMATLARFSAELEIYSIDEAFLKFDNVSAEWMQAEAHNLRRTVRRWTGLPVSVGVATTKTLAKIASERAKKDADLNGVRVLADDATVLDALARTPVGDVWGIGRQWNKRLKSQGVYTALEFAQLPATGVRSKMGVVGARTQVELLGTPVFSIENQPADRKSCVASRSFSKTVGALDDLKEAVANFAARVSERLNGEGMVAGSVSVFLLTDRFNDHASQTRGSAMAALAAPSGRTVDLTRAALVALEKAYRPGFAYKKAGVMALDLMAADRAQPTLFSLKPEEDSRAGDLQAALEKINGMRVGGRDLLHVGARSPHLGWHMRQGLRSPRYTTAWADLPRVHAR